MSKEKEKKVKDNQNVEEKQKVEKDVVFKHDEKLTYEYSSTYLENIESSRLEFSKKYKTNSYLKWVVSLVAIGLLFFAFLGIPNIVKSEPGSTNPLQIALMVSIAVISLGLMLGYSFITKRNLNKKAKAYFGNLYQNVTNFVFEDEAYTDVVCDAQKKIERIQFEENMLYANIYEVGSRATTEFKYKGIDMLVCDCAAQVKGEKRIRPVFVGKYVIAPADYTEDDLIAIYVKGDKRSLPPTNLDDLKCVEDNEKMSIHTNNKNWNKVITAKIKKLILGINDGKSLVDYSISMRSGSVFVCLGYDDDLMVLPLEKPFNPKPNEEYKVELLRVCELIKELNK